MVPSNTLRGRVGDLKELELTSVNDSGSGRQDGGATARAVRDGLVNPPVIARR